jgi:hypothetical protein
MKTPKERRYSFTGGSGCESVEETSANERSEKRPYRKKKEKILEKGICMGKNNIEYLYHTGTDNTRNDCNKAPLGEKDKRTFIHAV